MIIINPKNLIMYERKALLMSYKIMCEAFGCKTAEVDKRVNDYASRYEITVLKAFKELRGIAYDVLATKYINSKIIL